MNLIKAGVCIHLLTVGQDRPHLYVVLNDPFGDPPQVCLVNFSTAIKSDKTVVLNPGEPGMHMYVKEPSYVIYNWARIVSAEQLENIIKNDMSKRHHKACSAILLQRLREGVFKSDFTREHVLEFCQKAFGPKEPPKAPSTSKRGR